MVQFVYILQCYLNGHYVFYKGRTNNIKRRYLEHKKGHSKYTKRFNGNMNLVYLEIIEDLNKKNEYKRSIKREKQLKKWSRNKIKKEIKINNSKLQNLIERYLT